MAKFKKDADGKLVLDDQGDPIVLDDDDKAVSIADLSVAPQDDPDKKVVALGKYQRVEGERDEYKDEVEKLRGQIAELEKVGGNAEELKAKLDELTAKSETDKADFESRIAERDKEYALDRALLGAGVNPKALKAAKAYVDRDALKLDGETLSGLDLEAFKKDQAFLFEPDASVSTAAASRGAGGDKPVGSIRDGVEAMIDKE